MRRFAIAIGALAAVLGLLSAPGELGAGGTALAETIPGQTKPNIVLVLTDDQRWDTLWAMPGVLETIAANGVTFTNGFVVNPQCCPIRASLLTGSYSHGTGVYRNTPPNGGFEAFRDRRTIATALKAQGYTTALVGKYLNGYGAGAEAGAPAYVPPGWDTWAAFHGPPRYYRYSLALGPQVVRVGSGSERYSTTALGELALSFLRTAQEPFFLEFAPFAPHAPATPPPAGVPLEDDLSWWKPTRTRERDRRDKPAHVRTLAPLTASEVSNIARFERRQILAIAAVDDVVRRIVGELEARNVIGRTLIVFTSDNGMAWGAHELAAGAKYVPYEEAIRVPLVVRYDPLTAGRARDDERLVLNLDLAPTFAAFAGARLPRMDGRDLRPLLRPSSAPSWRNDFLIEHLFTGGRERVPTYCGLRTRRYKYVAYQTGEFEFYDLARDPKEFHNLHARQEVRGLERELQSRLSAACRPRPPGFTALDRDPVLARSSR
ncbi:MAG TPA: sulfatase [Gaiellaceae bacterium]|nr:sulfatase [Gaiellaceae bacterium]